MIPDTLKEVPAAAALEAWDGTALLGGNTARGEVTLVADPARIVDLCRFLKDEQQFERLSAVTAVDWLPAEPRFEVVYLLHSLARNQRLRLKCRLPGEAPEIASVVPVWRSANWYEREVFDLFGITFTGHPCLQRILLPEDWQGHPLRKDYPVNGEKYTYVEEGGSQ